VVRAIGGPFVPLSVDSPLSPSASAHTMSSQAGWDSVTGIATLLLGGNLIAIAIAIVIAFGVPILLHLVFYRAAASPPSSNFLLLGPSGAGKTAFTTLVRPPFSCSWSLLQNFSLTLLYSSNPSLRQLPKSCTARTPPRPQLSSPSLYPRRSPLRPIATDP
jgi:hypothetical protein